MNCDRAKSLISLYIDNELDEKERSEFQEHINTCEACRNELNAISETVNLLKSIPEVELPSNFREELHEKLIIAKEEEKRNKRKVLFFIRNNYFKAVSALAAGVAVIFALRVLFFGGFMAKGGMKQFTADSAMPEAAGMEKALLESDTGTSTSTDTGMDMDESSKLEEHKGLNDALVQSEAVEGEQEKSLTINIFNTDSADQKNEKEDLYSGTDTNSATNDIRTYASSGQDMPETIDREEIKGAETVSINTRGCFWGTKYAEDTFLKNATIRVRIVMNENVTKTEALEKIIQNYEIMGNVVEGSINDEDNIDDEDNNKSVIELNIKCYEYANLFDKIKAEMEASNLSVECGNPILIEDFRIKYDEYLSQLDKINNQLSLFRKEKNNSGSSEKTELMEDKANIENSIKLLLEKFEYVADAEMYINTR